MPIECATILNTVISGGLVASAAVIAVVVTQRSERKREAERFERERTARTEQFERERLERNDGLRRDRLEKLSATIFAFRNEVEAARESALTARDKVDTTKIYLSHIQMLVDLYLPNADEQLKTLIERTYRLRGRFDEIDPAAGVTLEPREIDALTRGVREAATALQTEIANEVRRILTLV